MPMILVCVLCGRSQVPVRTFELTFRGYLKGKAHNRSSMRRVKCGTADLCERCLEKLSPDAFRTFKDQDQFIEGPIKRYVRTKIGHFAEKPAERQITPENPENGPETP